MEEKIEDVFKILFDDEAIDIIEKIENEIKISIYQYCASRLSV